MFQNSFWCRSLEVSDSLWCRCFWVWKLLWCRYLGTFRHWAKFLDKNRQLGLQKFQNTWSHCAWTKKCSAGRRLRNKCLSGSQLSQDSYHRPLHKLYALLRTWRIPCFVVEKSSQNFLFSFMGSKIVILGHTDVLAQTDGSTGISCTCKHRNPMRVSRHLEWGAQLRSKKCKVHWQTPHCITFLHIKQLDGW